MNTRILVLLLTALLGGCNTDPSTSVQQPMTIRPSPTPPNAYHDGAIFQASGSRPMFEDRRARFVGDTLTVLLAETTSASKTVNESGSRSGTSAVRIGTPTILGRTPGTAADAAAVAAAAAAAGTTNLGVFGTSFSGGAAISSANKDTAANTNNFSGTLTVTVIEVLPNGNLKVSGEKQISINQESEYIRLSGIVNPNNVTSTNTVISTQLADARVESKTKQSVDTAQVVSMLSRFFVALLPF